MKKLLLVFVLLSVVVSNAQIVDIPDPNFKAALLAFGVDMNGDGEIQVSEAEAAYAIVADNSNISDLTGIEAFVNLTELYLDFNNLTSIDVSNNPNLTKLLVEFNQLESLDVSNNDQLIWLWFTGNNISEIDLSNNPNIQLLWVSNNKLADIDVTQIPSLASITLGNNLFSEVNVRSNPNLSHFSLTAGNMITELDLSNNPLLCSVVVGSNDSLEYINLRNGSNTLLVEGSTCYYGTGTSNSILLANTNPVLETICVDNVAFAQANFPHIPTQTVFIDDCLLGTDDFETSSISIYPNPTRDFITIASEEFISEIKVYNMLGELILKVDAIESSNTINLASFKSGVYFIGVSLEGDTRNFRIIKD